MWHLPLHSSLSLSLVPSYINSATISQWSKIRWIRESFVSLNGIFFLSLTKRKTRITLVPNEKVDGIKREIEAQDAPNGIKYTVVCKFLLSLCIWMRKQSERKDRQECKHKQICRLIFTLITQHTYRKIIVIHLFCAWHFLFPCVRNREHMWIMNVNALTYAKWKIY